MRKLTKVLKKFDAAHHQIVHIEHKTNRTSQDDVLEVFWVAGMDVAQQAVAVADKLPAGVTRTQTMEAVDGFYHGLSAWFTDPDDFDTFFDPTMRLRHTLKELVVSRVGEDRARYVENRDLVYPTTV